MEFLAIIAIFYLFNLLFGKKKPKKQPIRRREGFEDPQQRTTVEDDWERTMKELESIFTGKKEEPVLIEEVPEYEPSPIAVKEYQSPGTIELKRQRDLADFSKLQRRTQQNLDIDKSNPIYVDGVSVEFDVESDLDVAGKLTDPTTIVQAMVLKEVLDKPKALRRSF